MKKRAGKFVVALQLPVLPQVVFGPTGNSALASGCLVSAAIASEPGRHFELAVLTPLETDSAGDEALIGMICRLRPDILCLSLYLWNSERSLYIAGQVKLRLPSTTIIIGGPEVVSDNSFLLGQTSFDVAVTGEGEEPFVAVLDSLSRQGELASIPGVAVRSRSGETTFSKSRPGLFNLAQYPSPYLSGILPVQPDRSIYVETARGCVSRCSFCFYSRGHAQVRRLDVESVEWLLKGLIERGAKDISILDPSFNRRPDFRLLLERIARLNSSGQLSFFAEINADSLADSEIDLLAAAGFGKIEVGLQSVNRRTLAGVGRRGEPVEIIRKARLMMKRGIEPLVDLIAGLPGDSKRDFLRGVRMLKDHGLGQHIQVLPLSVLPGTALRAGAKRNGLVFDLIPPYRIVSTPLMKQDDISDAIVRAESAIGLRLDEYPRPFLCDAVQDASGQLTDVLSLNLDEGWDAIMKAAAGARFASHFSVRLESRDFYARRAVISGLIESLLFREPHSIIDIVLVARGEFPLDVIDGIRRTFAGGPPNYLTRHHPIHGENLSRRVACLVPRGVHPEPGFIRELLAEIPVYADMTAAEALERRRKLGVTMPCARVFGGGVPGGKMQQELAGKVDPEAVVFASRALEKWWVLNVLGYKD